MKKMKSLNFPSMKKYSSKKEKFFQPSKEQIAKHFIDQYGTVYEIEKMQNIAIGKLTRKQTLSKFLTEFNEQEFNKRY